eukprot:TRINITY_DN11485_c0_g1_i1.p2 TRINITY_DN11485_c0_g1~~TRINITY_DN11485_c0_g1_i1.p2  ORF type:complete len:189 (-),score=56.12 TRINITY_DN11485_c0_g1_i1:401-967(-)
MLTPADGGDPGVVRGVSPPLKLVETRRPPGQNARGMIAWRYTLWTPEYPAGRQAIVVANDITFAAGSFGVDEDNVFAAASQVARAEGIPFVYLAANSGARIGIAEDVRDLFSVRWVDPSLPAKGFTSLYLEPEAEAQLERGAATVGANRDLVDVIGAKHGLGVENLAGRGCSPGRPAPPMTKRLRLRL